MKRLVFHIATIFFLYVTAVNGTAVESSLAVLCAVIWTSLPKKKYKIVFIRHQIQISESPAAGWFKCQLFALIYRAKGEGRDTRITRVQP